MTLLDAVRRACLQQIILANAQITEANTRADRLAAENRRLRAIIASANERLHDVGEALSAQPIRRKFHLRHAFPRLWELHDELELFVPEEHR